MTVRYLYAVLMVAAGILFLAAPSAAVASEATLTEVVEAVKAGNLVAEENRTKLTHVEELLKGTGELKNIQESLVHDVGTSGSVTKAVKETNEKLAATLTVKCASGCLSEGGSGGEVTFATAAGKQIDGDTEAIEVSVYLLCGVLVAGVILLLWSSNWGRK